jgi:ankyrin repeat protein
MTANLEELLSKAVKHEDNLEVVRLLKQGVSVRTSAPLARDALATAVHKRNARLLQILVDYGVDVNDAATGATCLHSAVHSRSVEGVRMLLAVGADPNIAATYDAHETPLMSAVQYGPSAIVALLVEHGGNVRATTTDGRSVLEFARENDDNAATLNRITTRIQELDAEALVDVMLALVPLNFPTSESWF